MKKILILFSLVLSITFVGCNDDDGASLSNYVTFESTGYQFGVDINSSSSNDIKVYTSDISGTDRTYAITVVEAGTTADPAALTIPSAVTVPAGSNEGVFTVEISDLNIGSNGKTLELGFVPEEGVFIGKNLSISVYQVCPTPTLDIDIIFDGYGSETSWELADAEGTVIYSGGNYTDGQVSAYRGLCLPSGDYTFTAMDSYGDGLSYPADGSFTLSYGGEVIGIITGNYGSSQSVTFSL